MTTSKLFALGCAALLVAGCASNQALTIRQIEFDTRGWGGPNLDYEVDPRTGEILLRSGMMVHRDFRWGSSEFRFDFHDTRDLVWGIRLLDSVFRPARRADLRKTWVKVGPKNWKRGREIPPEHLLAHDAVAEMSFVPDPTPNAYKLMRGRWDVRILDEGLEAVRVEGQRALNIRRGQWNQFRVRVDDGEVTYWLNGRRGETGEKPIRIDSRANGRLGIVIQSGGPLRIRNLRFSGIVTRD
jgi:hypothetical protein